MSKNEKDDYRSYILKWINDPNFIKKDLSIDLVKKTNLVITTTQKHLVTTQDVETQKNLVTSQGVENRSDHEMSTFPRDTNDTFILMLENTFHLSIVPAIAAFAAICLLILLVIACICCFVCIRRQRHKKQPRRVADFNYEDFPSLNSASGEGSHGKIDFSLEYQSRKEKLKVGIIQGLNLPSPFGATMDPYVVLHLKPEGKSEKTKVVKKSVNPIWNEYFTFKIPSQDLLNIVLIMDVIDWDEVGTDNRFAQLEFPLSEIDSQSYMDKTWECQKNLLAGEDMVVGMGDICVILKYSIDKEKIDITFLEAKRLQLDVTKLHAPPDLVGGVSLYIDKKRVERKKSHRKRFSINPYFDETFSYKLPADKLVHAAIKVKMYYCDPWFPLRLVCFGSTELSLNDSSSGTQTVHWKEMINNPKRPIAFWHILWPK